MSSEEKIMNAEVINNNESATEAKNTVVDKLKNLGKYIYNGVAWTVGKLKDATVTVAKSIYNGVAWSVGKLKNMFTWNRVPTQMESPETVVQMNSVDNDEIPVHVDSTNEVSNQKDPAIDTDKKAICKKVYLEPKLLYLMQKYTRKKISPEPVDIHTSREASSSMSKK